MHSMLGATKRPSSTSLQWTLSNRKRLMPGNEASRAVKSRTDWNQTHDKVISVRFAHVMGLSLLPAAMAAMSASQSELFRCSARAYANTESGQRDSLLLSSSCSAAAELTEQMQIRRAAKGAKVHKGLDSKSRSHVSE
ncbi:unnamed protein product [Mycena citricolor]|uniref:Uncharacterized protein n=1 Tax=Mycena citricolor TaxID=2018698 RepID=A0AAD2HCI7_9AGAR|nr:unnamed protein product [Mycena citricolor]